jgi:hypothetical protein
MSVFDLYRPLLERVLNVLDAELEELIKGSDLCPDPDSWGYFDSMEQLTGLGFVACQTYLTETRTWFRHESKRSALACGPRHESGRTVAQVVNAAANHWKHQSEWDWSVSHAPRDATVEILSDVLGEPVTESTCYVTSNILSRLLDPDPLRLAGLLLQLDQWRAGLRLRGTTSSRG